ncbi:hypothetical protein JOQ06_029683 [Pogonophryne albipinna]|uniref:Methyltransferase type 11 domain-containing protein n=1 Tax=Pogonophryne albipinna TaxID=1090488 RepID=A0AAD6AXY8_9TELE|nr:hypothetical protein JOQ06_029683 [Pogonophryne albipinna]
MTYRLFEGKDHASSYWKFRISPSDNLIQQVLDFLEKHKGHPFELAVDVGCGSGQGTVLLAKHFASMVATDVSPAQVEMALQHSKEPNITYKQCVAEELPLADSSVDLEAHRVLKPRGCMALLNYTMEMELSYPDCCSQTLNQICQEFYAALVPYRSAHLGSNSIELYREAYKSLPYPDKEWHECVRVKRPMPLSSFMGFVESFSSYQTLVREDLQKATALSQDISHRLMSVMKVSSAETEVEVSVRYYCLLACKPEEA